MFKEAHGAEVRGRHLMPDLLERVGGLDGLRGINGGLEDVSRKRGAHPFADLIRTPQGPPHRRSIVTVPTGNTPASSANRTIAACSS